MIKDHAFVELALRKSAVDPERLRQAMETRKEMANFGIKKFVGAILVDKNLATREVVRELVEELAGFWIRCPTCKEPRCLGECDRHGDLKCASCEKSIEYPDGRLSEDDLAISMATRGGRRRAETPRMAAASPRHEPARAGRAPAGEVPREPRVGDTPRKPLRPAKPAAADSDAWFQPEPGLRDITKFQPQRVLGASSSGRLHALSTAEFGALKVLDRFLCHDKVRVKEWVEYSQMAQDLPAAATPRPVQLFREGAVTYIVRPFVGKPEDSLRARLAGMPVEAAEADFPPALLGELLETLLAFHAAHLVHGNLKPENVIFTEGKASLTDPGFHLLFQGLPREERIIALWETARYVAPEVLRGSEPTPESDVYAAGRIGEDLLAAASPGSVDPEGLEGLKNIIARMVHEDPVQRYPSAKEALRDWRASLSSKGAPASGQPAQRPAGRRSRPRNGTRGRGWVIGGRAALAAVLLALGGQTAAWYATRKAMASPERAGEIATHLLAEEIAALQQAPRDARETEEKWKELAETFRGTTEEARVSEAARGALKRFEEERTRTTAAAMDRAEALAARKEWPEALAALAAIESKETAAGRGRELIDRIAEGLHQDLGLVYVPPRAAENGRKATGAFLADAGLVTVASRNAGLAPEKAREGASDPDAPAAGITFSEAQEIARANGKRLPQGAEWDRLAEVIEHPRGLEVLAARRLRDVKGGLYQWVEDEAEDELSRAGYGWLRGGDRPGVPPTHPVRRKKTATHADVGVRLVRDLPKAGR